MARKIEDLLTVAMGEGASDLHLKSGALPFIRVQGELKPMVDAALLSPDETLEMAFSVMSNRQKQRFKEAQSIDVAYGMPALGRFRINIFQQCGSVSLVLRVIPSKVSSIKELSLPSIIEKIADEPRGLILVTGTTGSGKSTTLASIVDHINSTRSGHIVTIEDPVEFIHRDKRAYVSQREVDVDTPSFSDALRDALRQDPDVILVGEMRDFETISTALTAAETGHLVLSTLHTLDATETISRIVSTYPSHQQKSTRYQLASILRAVISMRLVRDVESKRRVPAVEVMVSTGLIRDYIVNEEKTPLISNAIAAGTSEYGMQTFDQSLFQLFEGSYISQSEALRNANNPAHMRMMLSGIRGMHDEGNKQIEMNVETIT